MVIFCATLAAFGAGCSDIRTGTAIRDPNASSTEVNVALLNPGKYATAAKPPLGTVTGPAAGAMLEARRMADALVLPVDIDSTMSRSTGRLAWPFTDTVSLSTVLPDHIGATVTDHNFIGGFRSKWGSAEPSARSIQLALLRFAGPEDARTAAAELAARSPREADTSGALPSTARTEHPTPDRPETAMFVSDTEYMSDVLAYTVHGPFVLAQAIKEEDQSAAITTALALSDQQRSMLDSFTPTPADALAQLPADPTGLFARTVQTPTLQNNQAGVYGSHGVLNLGVNVLRFRDLLAETGVDAISVSGAWIYRARDAAATQRLFTEAVDDMSRSGFRNAARVVGMPASKCLADPGSERTYCAVTTDRYLIEVRALSADDARQRIAAQYLMLTGS